MQMRTTKLNSHEKIVAIMANNRGKEWWYVHEIISTGNASDNWFIGYEGSARMAELVKKFPDMFETKDDGKYKKRRIRWEAMSEWFEQLPTSYRHIIHKTGATHGVIRKDPHAIVDEPEQAIEFIEYQAHYIGRGNIPLAQHTIKMNKLIVGKPIVVNIDLGNTKKQFVYKNVDDFKKDWRLL